MIQTTQINVDNDIRHIQVAPTMYRCSHSPIHLSGTNNTSDH